MIHVVRLDDAGGLVTEDGGGGEGVVTIDEMQVAVTDARSDDTHEHLAANGLVDIDFLDRQRLMRDAGIIRNRLKIDAAIEKLLNVEAPPRAQYIRTILTELSRIATFLLFLGEMGLQLGAMTAAFYAFRDREFVLNQIEAVTGGRSDGALSEEETEALRVALEHPAQAGGQCCGGSGSAMPISW